MGTSAAVSRQIRRLLLLVLTRLVDVAERRGAAPCAQQEADLHWPGDLPTNFLNVRLNALPIHSRLHSRRRIF